MDYTITCDNAIMARNLCYYTLDWYRKEFISDIDTKEDKAMMDYKNKIETEDLEQVAGGVITPEQAYQTALKHAGKKKTQVMLKKNKLDFDDGIQKYEIEFVEGFNEYEYDIDATNGMILKFEKDFCD